jgi:DNA-binding NarL/FixJ family response regulator
MDESLMLRVVRAYRSAEDALRNLPAVKPDVVLMDIKLPGMSGIQCVSALRALRPRLDSCILILSGHKDDKLLFEALKAGANGYLLKEASSKEQLQRAILEALHGGAPLSPAVAKKVVEYFHKAEASPRVRSSACSLPALSLREEGVLELLVKGFLYKQIADHLHVSINGVRKHVQSIYRKLEVNSRAEAAFRWSSKEKASTN